MSPRKHCAPLCPHLMHCGSNFANFAIYLARARMFSTLPHSLIVSRFEKTVHPYVHSGCTVHPTLLTLPFLMLECPNFQQSTLMGFICKKWHEIVLMSPRKHCALLWPFWMHSASNFANFAIYWARAMIFSTSPHSLIVSRFEKNVCPYVHSRCTVHQSLLTLPF